ncbi:MAG: cyclic nucleotide-binding domain-containing protein [Deltaproteobacteria bacterium]|nr:cyclic nucleotide-binding domain-containing protein [Deltaproteobacteria bacterium]
MNKPTIQVSELRRLGTFDWLSPDRLVLLSRNMEELRVAKGQAIYRSDEPAKQLFYVLEGLIAVSLLGSEGRFVRLTVVTPGEFFGITALVRGWRRLSTATALRDSRVGRIESHVFVKEVCGLPWELFGGLMDTSQLRGFSHQPSLTRSSPRWSAPPGRACPTR